MAGVIPVAYILYTVPAEVMERLGTNHLYLTFLFIIQGILRFIQITFIEEKSADPMNILLKDIIIIGNYILRFRVDSLLRMNIVQ